MAVIHATTPEEFVTAITTSGAEVYIDNDIDFNRYMFNSTVTISAAAIHGQGHNLNNIQFNFNGTLFTASTDLTFDEVNFLNCWAQSGVENAFFNPGNYRFTFEKCKFQGTFWYFSRSNVTCNKCSFTFEDGLRRFTYTPGAYSRFDQCYFDFKTQSTGRQFVNMTHSNGYIRNCYFKGTIHKQTEAPFYMANTFINNVINFEFVDSGTFLFIGNSVQSNVSIYNATKASGATITSQSNIKPLPDSDMRVYSAADIPRVAAAIAATGFPIVY